MKIYRLLLILLVASCSWTSAIAACNAHPTIVETHLVNGSIVLSVSPNGAHYPYTYNWYAGGQQTATDTVYYAGRYLVVFTDSLGCNYYLYDTITSLPCDLTGTLSQNYTGNNQYLVSMAPTHGSNIYYGWSAPPGITVMYSNTSQNICTVSPGHGGYVSCFITDSLTGCIYQDSIWLGSPCLLSTTVTTQYTGNAGFLYAASTGGHGTLSYHWSNGATSNPLTTTTDGRYCVTVSDTTGCTSVSCDSVHIHSFTPCTGIGLFIRDTMMNGPGLVAGVVYGHPLNTTYAWSTGSNIYNINVGIVSGQVYCVTATDHTSNCTATLCDTICTFSATVTDSISGSTNNFTVHPSGTAPYQYYSQNSYSLNGHYTVPSNAAPFAVTVADANGCFFTDSLFPHSCHLINGVTYSYDVFNHFTFYATNAYGTAPLSYSWTVNGYTAPGATSNRLSDSLPQGSYVICSYIRDANYCSAQSCDTIHVGPPVICNVAVQIVDTVVAGQTMLFAQQVAHTSGTPLGVGYQWSTGDTISMTSTIPGTHTYCVTVYDNFGCTATSCINTCTLTAAATAVASGNGWNQHATVSGAVGPVHYHWSSGDTTASFFTTVRGIYHVTVSDSTGCSVVLTDTAGSVCYFSGGISVFQNTGSVLIVSANVYNNHGPVSYVWSGGSSLGRLDTLTSSGRYCVTATDSIGCATTLCDSFVVGCHLRASITDSFVGNGYILTVHPDSGQAPYTYSWGLGNSGQSVLAVINGRWCMTVMDHSGCRVTACDSVYLPCNLTVSIADSNYGTYHALRAVKTGGPWQNTPIYTWTTPSGPQSGASPILVAQQSGTYCVTVRDTNGCTASACDTIQIGCQLSTSLTFTSNAANLYTFTGHTSGGSGRYSHAWRIDNYYTGMNGINPYSSTLTQGIHNVCLFIYDSVTNCRDSVCQVITAPAVGCTLSASVTQSISGSVAILTAHASGAHGPLRYYWPAGSTSAYLTATQSGTYCVTITDSAGCSATACDTLHLNGCNLHATYTSTHTGSIYIFTGATTGAHGAVTYQWRIDGGSLTTGSPYTATLAVGTHTVCMYARDTAQCRDSLCQALTVTSSGCAISGYIKDSVKHSPLIGNSHYYVPVVVNGTAPYTYHWSNGSTGAYVYTGFWQSTFNGTVTVTDANGCTAVLHMSSAYVNTFCGNVFNDINGNGVQDAGETGMAGQVVSLYSGSTLVATATTDAYGHYSFAVHPGTYTIRYTAGSAYAITIPLGSSTTPNLAQYGPFTISSNGNSYCGYNFGIRTTNVTITGYVYLDANNNGVYDAGETPVANQAVHVGPHLVYTNASGLYTYVGAAGSYAITYVPSSTYSAYTVTPSGISVNAATPGAIYGSNNFGLQQHTTACNIATTIIPITTVTAGYPSWYYVYVSNYGTNVASGTMTFYYDAALTYDHAAPSAASVNASTHSASFIYAGLQPGTYTVFIVYFTANTNVTVGQSTFEMATATDNCIESNFADNTDTLHQIATGSWDPNAKVVTPAGEGPQGLIRAGQELRYTLNFQNTGTAPAVNVVLRDSLPATLDPSTIKVLGSSHPDYVVQIEGRQLTCRYSQIMLADSFDSEPESHGFLSFAISPVAGIADGTQIQNTASIYFDYNDAVVTNTTLNTIDYTLSVKDVMSGATITVQPNPFSLYTTIRVTGADMHDATLEVYNALGQSVGSTTPSSEGVFTLQRNGLSAGMYSYHIRQAGRTIGSGKLVIE